jgi:hypothetical protein
MSSRDTSPKKKSRHKIALEPISMDEILAGPGMSGFVSILDPPEEVPHLQALVDDIRGRGGHFPGRPARKEEAEADVAPAPVGEPEVVPAVRPEVKKVPEPKREPDTQRVPGAERDTRPPAPAGARIRRAVLAQDGHSSGEEVLYQSLWNCRYASQETRETRLVTIGWKAMSKVARLTPRNTRRNCQSLIEKLAIEQLSEENSRESIGRTYRLFSYKTILERRRAAGMEWVTRARGVAFVASPAQVTRMEGVRQAPLFGVPGTERDPGIQSVPDTDRVAGAKRDTRSSQGTPDLVIRTLREFLPDVDDASVHLLIEACRLKTPDATDEEINHFVRIKADLMQRMGTIKSPMGFLKTSVPRCFEGESFRQFRESEARRREAAALREAAQEEEMRRFLEEQRAVLDNPRASEEERRFARHYLAMPEKG